jgi:hypothetical protein
LFDGEAWSDAAGACSDLLRDPKLPAAMRDDLAKRYALSVAMTGQAANTPPAKLPEGPARWLEVLQAHSSGSSGTAPGLAILRGALDRARHIETLLDTPAAHQGS